LGLQQHSDITIAEDLLYTDENYKRVPIDHETERYISRDIPDVACFAGIVQEGF
jgi:hypothetical protein